MASAVTHPRDVLVASDGLGSLVHASKIAGSHTFCFSPKAKGGVRVALGKDIKACGPFISGIIPIIAMHPPQGTLMAEAVQVTRIIMLHESNEGRNGRNLAGAGGASAAPSRRSPQLSKARPDVSSTSPTTSRPPRLPLPAQPPSTPAAGTARKCGDKTGQQSKLTSFQSACCGYMWAAVRTA